MKIYIDREIWARQAHGGIRRVWDALMVELSGHYVMTFEHVDYFMSTYYQMPPDGIKSAVLVYDMIAERYPLIGPHHPDAVDKRRAIALADKVIAISQATANDVERFTGRKVDAVAHCGIERDYSMVMSGAVERFQDYVGKPYILVVGNRGLYKNVQVLYQAWALWSKASEHRIVCVGGEPTLPADAAFDQAHPGVRLHLQLPDSDMPLAYSGAAALCYPSLMEGFGMPPLEALSCGCAVVCSEAMREVCGNHAYYADVTRPLKVVEALDAAVAYGAPALNDNWLAQFSWQKMAAKIVETLER